MEKLKSDDYKKWIMQDLLYSKPYLAVTTEYAICFGSIADIYAIKNEFFSVEIEIKVTKADLMGELRAIECLKNESNPNDAKCKVSKYSKHNIYFNTIGSEMGQNADGKIPNYFYFAVPPELEDIAIKGVEGTKYGVMVVHEQSYEDRKWADIHIQKKAYKLHKNEVPLESLKSLVHRQSLEIVGLREKSII